MRDLITSLLTEPSLEVIVSKVSYCYGGCPISVNNLTICSDAESIECLVILQYLIVVLKLICGVAWCNGFAPLKMAENQ